MAHRKRKASRQGQAPDVSRDLVMPLPDQQVVRVTHEELGLTEKFSDVIKRFAEPLLIDAEDYESTYSALTLAVLAWNLAHMPQHAQIKAITDIIRPMPPQLALVMKEEIVAYIARKEQFFNEYQWFVTNYWLRDDGNTYHLTVEVSIDPNDVKSMRKEKKER
ncbi:MAG: hypothetical protein ACYDBB_26965 [Armatimonadota bacterium]